MNAVHHDAAEPGDVGRADPGPPVPPPAMSVTPDPHDSVRSASSIPVIPIRNRGIVSPVSCLPPRAAILLEIVDADPALTLPVPRASGWKSRSRADIAVQELQELLRPGPRELPETGDRLGRKIVVADFPLVERGRPPEGCCGRSSDQVRRVDAENADLVDFAGFRDVRTVEQPDFPSSVRSTAPTLSSSSSTARAGASPL